MLDHSSLEQRRELNSRPRRNCLTSPTTSLAPAQRRRDARYIYRYYSGRFTLILGRSRQIDSSALLPYSPTNFITFSRRLRVDSIEMTALQ